MARQGEKGDRCTCEEHEKQRHGHFIFMHYGLVSGTQPLEQVKLEGPSPGRYLASGVRLVRDVCEKKRNRWYCQGCTAEQMKMDK